MARSSSYSWCLRLAPHDVPHFPTTVSYSRYASYNVQSHPLNTCAGVVTAQVLVQQVGMLHKASGVIAVGVMANRAWLRDYLGRNRSLAGLLLASERILGLLGSLSSLLCGILGLLFRLLLGILSLLCSYSFLLCFALCG